VSEHEQLQLDIADDIRRCRRSVLCIGAEAGEPAFSYTVGNAIVGLPELLVIGTTNGAFLNILSEKMIERGAAFDDGELVSLGRGPLKIINADERAHNDYTIQAGQYLGHENYRVQQVLICDRNGRYPDEPECQHPYSTIPVLKRRHH
jgi:hypothetical protein